MPEVVASEHLSYFVGVGRPMARYTEAKTSRPQRALGACGQCQEKEREK